MILNYYSRQYKLIKCCSDEDAHFIRVSEDKPDYLIIIEASNLNNISFIEVMDGDKFFVRHFIRFGKLVSIYSIEPDRNKCPLIRKQIVGDNAQPLEIKEYRLFKDAKFIALKQTHEAAYKKFKQYEFVTRLELALDKIK